MSPVLLDWIHALGWTLLHFLWQGALVGVLYGLARLALGRAHAQARYAAGLAALATLAALPIATLAMLAPATSPPSAVASSVVAAGAPVQAIGAATLSGIEPWLPWLVTAWLLGVTFTSLRALRAYWRMRELCRREARPLPEWDSRLRELCVRFGVQRPVRLLSSAVVQAPSLIGWIAPVIVLPASTLVGLSPHQVSLVIAHELGHIRRFDYAVNLLQIAVETVLFYHPVVHWISRDVRDEREACCDDLVLRLGADPLDYASTLASLEELRGVTHTPVLAASGGFLLGRIRRIVGVEPSTRVAPPSTAAHGLLLLALAGVAALAVKPVPVVFGDDEVLAAGPELVLAQAAAGLAERALSGAPANASRAPASDTAAAAPAAGSAAPLRAVVEEPPAARSTAAPIAEVAPEFSPTVAPPVEFEAAAAPRLELAVVPSLPALLTDEAQATVRVAPAFPRRARIAGVEGQVTLSFAVDGAGRARDIRVVDASPAGTFEEAAVEALRQWRFEREGARGSRFVQTFDFSLAADAAVGEDCTRTLGSRICRRLGGDREATRQLDASFRDAVGSR